MKQLLKIFLLVFPLTILLILSTGCDIEESEYEESKHIHTYEEPIWSWDNFKATATFTCTQDSSHVEIKNAYVSNEITTPKTCKNEGVRTYTAKVNFNGQDYSTTKTEIIPAEHVYGAPEWTWTNNNSASAKFTCLYDSAHTEILNTVIPNPTKVIQPTCATNGSRIYNAKITFNDFIYIDKKTEIIPALGHNYNACSFTWNGYESAKITFSCSNNQYHTKTLNATITNKILTEASCIDGEREYTATVDFENQKYTDKKKQVISATKPHNYADTENCLICNKSIVYTTGLEFNLINNNTAYEVCGIGSVTDEEICIPKTYNGFPVTKIGDYAFENCSNVKNIYISKNITVIGTSAFSGCTKLTQLTIPGSVKRISSGIIENSGIKSVILLDGVESIGEKAFYNCRNLTEIVIPNTVNTIGSSAFYNCTNLTKLNIPSSIYIIGSNAFYNCFKIIEVEKGVSYVDKWVINCENSATGVTLREDTAGLAAYAFSNCTELTEINIPNTLTSINSNAFNDCPKLKYNVKDGVKYLGNNITPYLVVMNADSSITSITLPDTILIIHNSAFSNCNKLTSITIPNEIICIDDYAFFLCPTLTNITYQGTKSEWNAVFKGLNWNTGTGNYTVHCTDGDIIKS